jgi:hypothetical protein
MLTVPMCLIATIAVGVRPVDPHFWPGVIVTWAEVTPVKNIKQRALEAGADFVWCWSDALHLPSLSSGEVLATWPRSGRSTLGQHVVEGEVLERLVQARCRHPSPCRRCLVGDAAGRAARR